jgi:hypothetical protein
VSTSAPTLTEFDQLFAAMRDDYRRLFNGPNFGEKASRWLSAWGSAERMELLLHGAGDDSRAFRTYAFDGTVMPRAEWMHRYASARITQLSSP